MPHEKQTEQVAAIIGVLVKNGASAKEALKILDEVETTYLERCWHVASDNTPTPQKKSICLSCNAPAKSEEDNYCFNCGAKMVNLH